jgi:hypothetical protein
VDAVAWLGVGAVRRIEGAGQPTMAVENRDRVSFGLAWHGAKEQCSARWMGSTRPADVRARSSSGQHLLVRPQCHKWQRDGGRRAAQQAARARSAAGDTDATRQQQLGTQAHRDAGSRGSSVAIRPSRRDKARHEVTANASPT